MDARSTMVDVDSHRMQTATEKWWTGTISGFAAVNLLACEVESNRMSCRRSRYDVEVASLASAALRLMAKVTDYVPLEMAYYERKPYQSRPRHLTGSAADGPADEKQALLLLLRLLPQQYRCDDFGDESTWFDG